MQHPAVMCTENYWGIINVDFDATCRLLIIYCAFVKYFRKNGKTMKQCISYLHKVNRDKCKFGASGTYA